MMGMMMRRMMRVRMRMKKDDDPLPAGISLQWASLKKGHLSTACVRTCVPEISSRRATKGDVVPHNS